MTSTPSISRFSAAAPFWMSLILVPLAIIAAVWGGWALLLLPAATWYLFSVLDYFAGLDKNNKDPLTPDNQLQWYRLITLIWPPVQVAMIFGILFYVSQSGHLTRFEEWALFAGIGIVTGTIGINYSHELMHQKPKSERFWADVLLASVLYSHFRSEHLLVHHRYVATPRDPVSARFGEGFHTFLWRVLRQCYPSAFNAEAAMLARKGKVWTDKSNPFWRYWFMQTLFLLAAVMIGGVWGLFLFGTQAFWAIFHLELVNYIEHYGLTRKHFGEGKYEHVMPRHSWNASQKASNFLLINLQRHSDHHFKPDRRFPLLQNHDEDNAPQLPYSYLVMGMIALVPPAWRKIMNPKVLAWRAHYYPEITDWAPYRDASNPVPR